MKIGLLGSYADVARLVDAPATPVQPKTGLESFENLLGDIGPDAAEQPRARFAGGTSELPPGIKATDANIALMPTPQAKPPTLLAIAPSEFPSTIALDPVKEAASSVKTPDVIDVRRVPTAAEFSKLPRGERMEVVEGIAKGVGEKYGIDPLLSMAVVSAESSFNTEAISQDGHASKGLMQLLDKTGARLHQVAQLNEPYAPFEPGQNMELGVKYFSSSTDLSNGLSTVAAANSTSLEKLAVAAFNAGEGRVASAQQRARNAGGDPAQYDQVAPYLPESTREYVDRVMQRKQQYEARFIG